MSERTQEQHAERVRQIFQRIVPAGRWSVVTPDTQSGADAETWHVANCYAVNLVLTINGVTVRSRYTLTPVQVETMEEAAFEAIADELLIHAVQRLKYWAVPGVRQ